MHARNAAQPRLWHSPLPGRPLVDYVDSDEADSPSAPRRDDTRSISPLRAKLLATDEEEL